jgi:hypothetical protein
MHEPDRSVSDLRDVGNLPVTRTAEHPVDTVPDLRPRDNLGRASASTGTGLVLLIVAWLVLVLALVWLFWVDAANAQPPYPAPLNPTGWTYGGSTPDIRHTWWTKPGDREDTVFVEGGATGAVFCQGGLCVLNVHGVWTRIYADGLVAERYGVFLPMVGDAHGR